MVMATGRSIFGLNQVHGYVMKKEPGLIAFVEYYWSLPYKLINLALPRR